MKTTARLTYISPIQLGIVGAVVYGVMGVLIGALFLTVALASASLGGRPTALFAPGAVGVAMAILMPFFYAFGGFVGGLITAALYNVAAGWTGGIRYSVVPDMLAPTP